jgi:hypothetical protein
MRTTTSIGLGLPLESVMVWEAAFANSTALSPFVVALVTASESSGEMAMKSSTTACSFASVASLAAETYFEAVAPSPRRSADHRS